MTLTKRQANTIIGGIIAVLLAQILCTAVLLRGQERTRKEAEASMDVLRAAEQFNRDLATYQAQMAANHALVDRARVYCAPLLPVDRRGPLGIDRGGRPSARSRPEAGMPVR
jgi:hypothetical protein